MDYKQYIQNYSIYQQNYKFRDKIPDFLYLLPIFEKPWQYILYDFKSFPKDKKGYNNIFITIN